jgi:hypothetical protein
MFRLQTFSLETKGQAYIVRSESLTATHEWMLRNILTDNCPDSAAPDKTELTVGGGSLRYGPREISRLNAQKQKKRRQHGFQQGGEGHKLPDLLRALGEHLDMKEASALDIFWTTEAALVEYCTPDGVCERKNLTIAKLHQFALRSKFRRTHRRSSIGPAEKLGTHASLAGFSYFVIKVFVHLRRLSKESKMAEAIPSSLDAVERVIFFWDRFHFCNCKRKSSGHLFDPRLTTDATSATRLPSSEASANSLSSIPGEAGPVVAVAPNPPPPLTTII